MGIGEGVEAHDAALVVDGEVGGNKGVEEVEAGGLGGFGNGGGGGTGWVLEVPVGFVFDDNDVVLDAEGVDFLTTGHA